MNKVQAGDLSKMGLLYERYNRDLFAYFFRCCGDQNKSEDLVHSVFVRIIKYAHNFEGHGQFNYWLFATARNVWFDEHRKKEPVKKSDSWDQNIHDTETVHSPEDVMQKKERKHLLKKAMMMLSPEKREAIELSRFQGLKYKEIASIANCTENAIKSRVQRGIIELKEIIEKLEK